MRNARLKNTGIKKRKKNRERAAGEWVTLVAVFLIILLGVKFAEFTGRAFPLRSVEMKCRASLDPNQLQSVRKMELGASMFRIDPGSIVKELSRYPKVKNVKVVRNFPEGKVEIIVNERTAFFRAVEEGSDKYMDVDENGRVIGEAENISADVPFVTLPPGQGEARDKILAKAARFVKDAGKESIPAGIISELDLRDPDNLILCTEDGVEFQFGIGDFAPKLKKARKVMGQIRAWGIRVEYVDLRFGGEAVIKPRT